MYPAMARAARRFRFLGQVKQIDSRSCRDDVLVLICPRLTQVLFEDFVGLTLKANQLRSRHRSKHAIFMSASARAAAQNVEAARVTCPATDPTATAAATEHNKTEKTDLSQNDSVVVH